MLPSRSPSAPSVSRSALRGHVGPSRFYNATAPTSGLHRRRSLPMLSATVATALGWRCSRLPWGTQVREEGATMRHVFEYFSRRSECLEASV